MRKGYGQAVDDLGVAFLHVFLQQRVVGLEVEELAGGHAYGAVVAQTDVALRAEAEVELQLLQILFGEDYCVAGYVLGMVNANDVAGEVHEHVVLGDAEVAKVDAAVDDTLEAYEHGGGLQAHGMGKEAHVTEIVGHEDVFVIAHKVGNVLLKKSFY